MKEEYSRIKDITLIVIVSLMIAYGVLTHDRHSIDFLLQCGVALAGTIVIVFILFSIFRWNKYLFNKRLSLVLGQVSSVCIFSLNPDYDGSFHGKKVVGEAMITDAQIVHALVTALKKDLAKKQVSLCFNPHHGLRFTNAEKTYDVMICYECFKAYLYIDDKKYYTTCDYTSQKILDGLFRMHDVKTEMGVKLKQQREAALTKATAWRKSRDNMRIIFVIIILLVGVGFIIIQKFLGH